MRVVSVNAGGPREIEWEGEKVRTSIFKAPVHGRVLVRRLNLDGDLQSDLDVHGGVEKAVYAYPSEHYGAWRRELPGTDLPFGAFGENLTIEGLLEEEARIGDRIRVGSAEFVVTQPRMPCFKLGIRLGVPGIVEAFQQSGRSGFYLSVAREGDLGAGDALSFVSRDPAGITVADIVRLRAAKSGDPALLRRASELPALPASLRERFRSRLG